LIRFTPHLILAFTFRPLIHIPKFQSDWSTCIWVIAIFTRCVKIRNRKKWKKFTKLFTCVLQMAKGISFKFKVCYPLFGEQLHYKYGATQLRHHEAIYVWKIVNLFFLSIYSLCLRGPCFLRLHDTLLCVLITYYYRLHTNICVKPLSKNFFLCVRSTSAIISIILEIMTNSLVNM